KKSPLNPSEYAQMKQHSYKTLELLTPMDTPCDIARWAANHHERLDGSGYPFRLCAASLDIPSRIVAVADVFTALTENRPYRRGMTVADALKIIQRNVENHQLDRKIVSLLY
ncbi:TPA: HD domain-containing protein, partial [Enterobacter cancerogenus]|nr:HD domain-containing protein [Enterobacter cancerogenus]